jgi:putative ABC transport system permease protein
VTGIGLVGGLAVAFASMRLLTAVLFGVSPFDPLTYGAVFAGLAATSLVATWLPARQATSVDPALALRGE